MSRRAEQGRGRGFRRTAKLDRAGPGEDHHWIFPVPVTLPLSVGLAVAANDWSGRHWAVGAAGGTRTLRGLGGFSHFEVVDTDGR